jgi:acyl-CoA thioesterase
MEKAEQIVKEMMLANDAFSQWMGIRILEIEPGYCKLEMRIRPEMCNGFSIAHGGISFSLADSALAFASNAHGIKALSIETSINHLKPLNIDDLIVAEAVEQSKTNKLGIFDVKITCGEELRAIFKGMVYYTGKAWIE